MRFRSAPAVLMTLLFSAALLLSACTDPPDDVPTAQPTPSATTPTMSADEQEKAAAVAAFVKGQEVFDAINAKGGSSNARSQLEPYMDGDFLDLLTASLADTKKSGGTDNGKVKRWGIPKSDLTRSSGKLTIELVACADYSEGKVWDKNGREIDPRGDDEFDVGEVTMTKVGDGPWKATQGNSDPKKSVEGTPCAR